MDLNSQSRQQPLFWNHLVSWLRAIPRVAILSMVGPSLLCVLGYFGWLYYGAHKLDVAYYGLKKESVYITTQPTWIRKTKVLDDVFDGGSLSRQSLLDAKTPGYLASVFDLHPWVRKTQIVQPLAGGVKIDLEYRRPVAMVACKREGKIKHQFFPIDAEAVLLDTEDFIEDDVSQYISIYAENADTSNNKGKPFGDPRIEEAARLCRLLQPIREAYKITRVMVNESARSPSGKCQSLLEIQTTQKTPKTEEGPKFLWGSCPIQGAERLGEPTAEVKLNKLMEIVSDNKQWKPGRVDLSGAQK